MRSALSLVAAVPVLLWPAASVHATPSSIIIIPSTDTVGRGTVHLDLDTLFTVGEGAKNNSTLSLGATYGVTDDLEVGFDYLSDTSDPLIANVKYQVYEDDRVTVALGGWLLGDAATTGGNQVYGLVSYDSDAGRFAVGYASGSRSTFGRDQDQLWLSYDRELGDRWWLGADYVSGESFLGGFSFGAGYSVAENAGLIVGYSIYNDSALDNILTVQVDVDLE
jgi:hypothetical protein